MITLINPNLVVQRNDPFTTGIVYIPISLAYFASAIRQRGFECTVIDAFGENPNQHRIEENFLLRGLTPSEVVKRIPNNSRAIVLYAINLTNHRSLIQMAKAIRVHFPRVSLLIMENTQAVTAYSLRRVQEEFYEIGADYVITGEAEERGIRVLEALQDGAPKESISNISGIGFRVQGVTHYTPPTGMTRNLDELPFPAWDLFPLQNYWRLEYAHGPFETSRYLPILTSRGCPYPCKFCVIPETNDVRWRARSAKNVVDEMEEFFQKLNVREFHVEDVDPTVNDKRTREICNELIRRKFKPVWKISAGTKVETMRDETTIELMAKAGCNYISISPESGSPRLLKMMRKPFNLEHAVRLVKKMDEVGIYSQACFVLGYPDENDEDRQKTWEMVRDLTKVGVDEIALFIVTPVPGSAIYDQFSGFTDYSQLNFSPSWRKDYEKLNDFRLRLYRNFLLWKLRYHPLKVMRQPINFVRRRFETKMEMTPYRALHTALLNLRLAGARVS
jgi:anaerobic magnesium-protoporphyrin IX monomethyl ester cyclase